MLAGRMGGGGMRPPENDLKKAQTEAPTVIEKPPMESLLEKKTTVVKLVLVNLRKITGLYT